MQDSADVSENIWYMYDKNGVSMCDQSVIDFAMLCVGIKRCVLWQTYLCCVLALNAVFCGKHIYVVC